MHGLPPRLEGLLRSGNARDRWLLVLLIAALPCLDLLVFTWGAANTMITRDQWHFLPMIRDYFSGQFHAFSLWETHSQHRTPGYKLLFLANAALFGLDMRFEIMLGAATLVLAILLLMKRFRDTLPASAPYLTTLLGLAAIAITGFNLNQWGSLVYALTALAGYAGILCFVWLWLLLDTQLRSGTSAAKVAGLSLALAFTLMSFGAGMGPALIVTLLLVPAGVMLIERRVTKEQVMLLGALALSSLICELIYWRTDGIVLKSPHSQPFMSVFMQDPMATLQYLMLAFASSALPADAIEKHLHGLGHTLNLLTGAGVICIYAVCGLIYLRLRMWKASYLPAFLLAFSALFVLSTLIVRLPSTGLGTSEAPRYALYSQMGLIGCLWILFHWLASRGDAPARPRRLLTPALCFGMAAIIYCMGLIAIWDFYPHMLNNNVRAVQEVLTGDFSQQQDWVCPNQKLCNEGRATLAQYHLNVFAGQPAAGSDARPQP